MDYIEITSSWDRFRERFPMIPQDGPTLMLPEFAALMLMIARAAPDEDELFPRGKWAMIQHLEGELNRAIDGLFSEDSRT